MFRLALVLTLFIPASTAFAAVHTCRLSGTAYDSAGNPLPSVVRLVDRQTRQIEYRATNQRAEFAFDDLAPDASGQRYQLDLLSPPTVVTGSRIPTRSILGIAPRFACVAGQTARADVRVQAD